MIDLERRIDTKNTAAITMMIGNDPGIEERPDLIETSKSTGKPETQESLETFLADQVEVVSEEEALEAAGATPTLMLSVHLPLVEQTIT